jgi:hypothetical protein
MNAVTLKFAIYLAAVAGIVGIVLGVIDHNLSAWLIAGAWLFGASMIAAAIGQKP